jgi:site-specific recombinase XerD
MEIQDIPAHPAVQDLTKSMPTEDIKAVHSFLTQLVSSRSRLAYIYGLKNYVRQTGKPLLAVTTQDLREWLGQEIARGANVRSLRTCLTSLRSFYNHLTSVRPEVGHPFHGFKPRLPEIRDGLSVGKKFLTMEQIRLVLSRIDTREAQTGREVTGGHLFRWLASTGMRVSEALSIEYFSPAKDGPAYVNWVRPEGDRQVIRLLGKARKLREVRVGDELSVAIGKRFEKLAGPAGQPVFLTRGGQRLGRHGALRQMKGIHRQFMSDLGVKNFGCHHLRHALATHLLAHEGLHPLHVARTLGNSVSVISRFYLHDQLDILKDVKLVS